MKDMLNREVEADMVDASALMREQELLENASEDYRRGFYDGYALRSEMVNALTEIYLKVVFKGGN